MFVIKQTQVDTFAHKAKDDFIDRMVTYIQTKFPKKYYKYGKTKIRRHATATMGVAKQYGFETERQIVSFLDLGLRYGGFSKTHWAREWLDIEAGDPERRMRRLQEAALRATGRIRS